MREFVPDLQTFLDEWIRAERRGDVTTLRGLLSDDFVAVQPDGAITRKTEWLQRYQRATLVHEVLRLSIDLRVARPHGVVVIGNLHQVSSFGGKGISKSHHVAIVIGLVRSLQLLAVHFAESGR